MDVCVCLHVCMCMHECVYTCLFLCVHVCTHVFMCVVILYRSGDNIKPQNICYKTIWVYVICSLLKYYLGRWLIECLDAPRKSLGGSFSHLTVIL